MKREESVPTRGNGGRGKRRITGSSSIKASSTQPNQSGRIEGRHTYLKLCFFLPPALRTDLDLRLARSTFTKPDFKMIARRGVEQSPRGSHWAIRQQRQILDSLSMTGRQRVWIGCSDWHRQAAARLLTKAPSLSRLHEEQGCRPRQPATPGKVVISQGCGRNRQPNGAHHGISRTNHHAAYPAPRSRAYARIQPASAGPFGFDFVRLNAHLAPIEED